MKHSTWRLERLAAKLLKQLQQKNATISVFLLSNREMEQLKRRFSRLNIFHGKEAGKIKGEASTNVLSLPEPAHFPMVGERKKRLGEVYLNYEYAGTSRDTLACLLVHGLLHLLGYKHDKRRDMIEMQKLEKKLYRAAGLIL